MKFFVFLGQGNSSLPSFDLIFLLNSFSSKSSLSNQSLDLRSFVSVSIDILFALESSSDDVLLNQGARVLKSLLILSFLDSV